MKKIVSNIDEEIGYLYSQLRYHNDCFEADLLPKLKKSRPIFRIQNIKSSKFSTTEKGKYVMNDAAELFYKIERVHISASFLGVKKRLAKKHVKDIKGLKQASINLMENMLGNMIKAVGKNQGKLLKSQILDNLEFLLKLDR
jgi:hypothetical protein